MNDQNGETLKLSHLIEGLYMFKVSVSAPGAYGETYANVTVLPREYHQFSSPLPPSSNIDPSRHTTTLGSTQPLAEMSTRNFQGSIGQLAHKADNHTAFFEPVA
jgi:hypothetical protein